MQWRSAWRFLADRAQLGQIQWPIIVGRDEQLARLDCFAEREGDVIRHPDALDTASRTMLVEVDLPNKDHALLPGMYAKLDITVSAAQSGSMVRDDALVFRDNRVFVPIVRDNHLHLVPVKLGYDNGNTVVVEGDIRGDDLVALNVGQAATDGEVVHPVYAQN